MLDPILTQEIIALTRQTDRVSLVSSLVGSLNKLTHPIATRFFDIHHEIIQSEDGVKRDIPILIEPLDPNSAVFPAHALEGVEVFLSRERDSFLAVPLSGGGKQRLIFPVQLEGELKSILVQDVAADFESGMVIVRLFHDMFVNLQQTIRAKDQDPLTGLFNRRSFDHTISQVLDAFSHTALKDRSPGHGACLAVLDIDFFKRINDQHGHAIGDEVLILFARLMEQMFRHGDRLYRFGGEEFLAILIEVDLEKAAFALERFRLAVEERRFPQVGQVTVSVGAVMVNTMDYPPVLLEKADHALYYAKTHGRNQTHFFENLLEQKLIENVEHLSNDIVIWDA